MAAAAFLKIIALKKDSRAMPRLLVFFSILAVLALYYSQNSFLEAFEAKTYDLRFKSLRGAIPPSPEIAIVAIDDKSIAELGRFPWTRSQYVRLLDRLSEAGARVVLFDTFFPERESVEVDQAFADAVRKAGNVVLATTFDLDSEFHVVGSASTLPEIEGAAAGVGHINFLPEDDGVNRRNRLLIEADGKTVPSLGLAGAMAALGEKKYTAGSFEIKLGDRHIPVDGDYSMWINYTGPPGSYPRFSFADVVNGRVDPGQLKDKIIFVGATALGVYDMRVTPFHSNMPGVEVHATITDNIISERFIRQAGPEALLDIALIIILGLTAFYLASRIHIYRAMPAIMILSAGYVWLVYHVFLVGHWASMIYPLLSAFIAVLVGGGFRYLVLERSAREMRSMFSSYVSAKLVSRLEKEPEAVKIGGDTKEVTILFTDIKGFTSFSEKRTPQEVVARLNEYLAAMVQVVDQFDGTVDKFIGDGIMVYWGAPLAQPDHAKLAMECILAMQKAMVNLHAKWKKEGVEPFFIRGGVQSGEVVAGNVGFLGKKMEYTVIGDTVNQAARLEGAAKHYGVDFLVGENTYRQARDAYVYRELDKIRVVGKELPITIYELIGDQTKLNSELPERFSSALALYRARRWEDARNSFRLLVSQFPGDEPSKVYLDRCDYLIQNPPPANWDGVFNRRDK